MFYKILNEDFIKIYYIHWLCASCLHKISSFTGNSFANDYFVSYHCSCQKCSDNSYPEEFVYWKYCWLFSALFDLVLTVVFVSPIISNRDSGQQIFFISHWSLLDCLCNHQSKTWLLCDWLYRDEGFIWCSSSAGSNLSAGAKFCSLCDSRVSLFFIKNLQMTTFLNNHQPNAPTSELCVCQDGVIL